MKDSLCPPGTGGNRILYGTSDLQRTDPLALPSPSVGRGVQACQWMDLPIEGGLGSANLARPEVESGQVIGPDQATY